MSPMISQPNQIQHFSLQRSTRFQHPVKAVNRKRPFLSAHCSDEQTHVDDVVSSKFGARRRGFDLHDPELDIWRQVVWGGEYGAGDIGAEERGSGVGGRQLL